MDVGGLLSAFGWGGYGTKFGQAIKEMKAASVDKEGRHIYMRLDKKEQSDAMLALEFHGDLPCAKVGGRGQEQQQ